MDDFWEFFVDLDKNQNVVAFLNLLKSKLYVRDVMIPRKDGADFPIFN